VLESAKGEYDDILCLGDLIGYGADPNAVVDWAREHASSVVRGNHDKASVGLEDLDWFNPVARAAALWTQRELTAENAEYIRLLPKGPIAVDGFHLVHGSPLDEDEYMIASSDAMQALTYVEARINFFGHTHMQGGFQFRDASLQLLQRPDETGVLPLVLDQTSIYLLNPGSVGQPRDGDPRAAYAVYDPAAACVTYCRVSYDIERAQSKIRRAGLPPVLAERLAHGR
jgi:diadenosine tetraphosphatase ApaH/serine/threonine PP2A family protein phosphatase